MDASEILFDLIPLFEKKFIRSVAQQAKTSLSPMQINTMATLQKHNTCTMVALANEILMSKQQLTPIIDKLVAEGFVRRELDASDRRVVKIALTLSGVKLLENYKKDIITVLNARIEGLGKEDLLGLTTSLNNLSRIVQKLP